MEAFFLITKIKNKLFLLKNDLHLTICTSLLHLGTKNGQVGIVKWIVKWTVKLTISVLVQVLIERLDR